jgi:hypothetical protein
MSTRRRGASRRMTTNAYGIAVPLALLEAIEAERDRLSQADSVLGCLIVAMEHPEEADNPYYPDVVRHARTLVKQSLQGLDSMALKQGVIGAQVKEDGRDLKPEVLSPTAPFDVQPPPTPVGIVGIPFPPLLRIHRRDYSRAGRMRSRTAASAISALVNNSG